MFDYLFVLVLYPKNYCGYVVMIIFGRVNKEEDFECKF